jgi:hypothetical protein
MAIDVELNSELIAASKAYRREAVSPSMKNIGIFGGLVSEVAATPGVYFVYEATWLQVHLLSGILLGGIDSRGVVARMKQSSSTETG